MKIFGWSVMAILLTLAAAGGWYYSRFLGSPINGSIAVAETDSVASRISAFTDSIKNFAGKKYNNEIGFLVDMNVESGKNRFFIMDLTKDSVLDAGLVTHGRCNERWLKGRKYSNVVGSGCTSLGKYRVANAYQGQFGLAYKLHGLDASNNNAFKRYVVLHSHECVPDKETFPTPLCQSDGCPTVSPAFLLKLQKIIDNSSKPLILWIYE